MFSLDIPAEPHWIDLPQGVRVKIKPIDAVTLAAAQASAADAVVTQIKQHADLVEAGLPADHLLDLEDRFISDAFARLELARGLARYAAVAWEGVGDADGAELSFSKDAVARLVSHPLMMQPFIQACSAAVARLAAEGNVSAPSPNGPTAQGAITAVDAPQFAATAQDG